MKLGALELKPNFKLMMVGSLEADIEDVCNKPDDIDEVVNDLDVEDDDVAVEYTEVNLILV